MKKAKRQFKVQAIINQAIADGKASAVVKPVWTAIGMHSISALKDLVARTPANPAFTSTQAVAAGVPADLDAILIQVDGQIQNLFSPLFDRMMALTATIDAFREVALNASSGDSVIFASMFDALDCISPDDDFLDAMVDRLTGLMDRALHQAQQRPEASAELPATRPASSPRKRDQLAAKAFQDEGVPA